MIDGDLRTLHIRCGSDIRENLVAAGFGGDFLEYSDPVCEGPVPLVDDLVPVRAAYLALAYGGSLGFTEAEAAERLRDGERRLGATNRYERVVLWFEHDNYDQLVLARVLALLAEGPLPACLELICIDTHPDVPRFNGLGQLGPSALAGLWPGRRPVTAAQIALGQAIWAALRSPDPSGLLAIARSGTPALPVAARALLRHLQELPGADGLSLTQRIVLTILLEGDTRIGRIFGAMVGGREPLVFMGDLGLLGTVEKLAASHPPVLTVEPGPEPFPRVASITETGRLVLAGSVDFLSLRPAERWVGGVRVDGTWRWDDAGGLVLRGT